MSPQKVLKIFLCHSSADKSEVKQLHALLLKHGAAPWLDAEQLLPRQDWNLEINKALDDSDVILVCLSKSSINKEGYVQREVRIALDRALEMPEGRIFLIPVRLEECELPSRLRTYQYVDLFAEGGIEKLIKSLNIRAKQVKAAQLSSDHDQVSKIKKPAPEKKNKARKPSTSTTINIHGDITGGNVIVGDNNEVSNK
jgi:hypothetical protein